MSRCTCLVRKRNKEKLVEQQQEFELELRESSQKFEEDLQEKQREAEKSQQEFDEQLARTLQEAEDKQRVLEENLQEKQRETEEILQEKQREADEKQQEFEAAAQEKQREFDDEMRKVRFELGEAEGTITEHQSTNEQLTSNLLDNQSTTHDLEERLSKLEADNEESLSKLKIKSRKLETSNEDLDRKLRKKDEAISALMAELASRSNAKKIENDIDIRLDALDQMPEPEPGEDAADKPARVSRLLIGTVDGQELQFPLFKNRLTIGRTANNDIQLETQFISRRHAVIVTERGETRIIDWGSKNGIRVNHKFVKEEILQSGDVVTIGTADFRYQERPKR